MNLSPFTQGRKLEPATIGWKMKPTKARLGAIVIAGFGMFLAAAYPASAQTEPPVDAAGVFPERVSVSTVRHDSTGPSLVAAKPGRTLQDTGSPELFALDLERAFRDVQARNPKNAEAAAEAPLQINVVFHVLSGASLEGNLSESTLADQVSVINTAYQSSGLQFRIAEVRRYPNSPYFAGGCFPTTESGIRMKSELAVDSARFVNIYTCKLDLPYIAGYGTLPDEFPEGDPRHGLVIDYAAISGGSAPLDLGHTLVHELGHYFGLLHTFQGGCADPGDGISDTPAEASPAYGCQFGRDSCPQAGLDPINNYMDYSEDQCTDRFTALQGERMRALIGVYRPHLAGAAKFTIGPGITGNWFDPDESGHGFSVEVLPDNQMLAQWYVFAPDGGQVWIAATGPISGDTAVLQGYREEGAGARFPPNFDPTQLQAQLWGTLTFTFTDCNHGHVRWQSVIAGYVSGSVPISRLTMPAGLTCP